jgi:archaellum biogenesis protein FlaJ (TadC family)
MFSSKKDVEGTVEILIALAVAYVFLLFLGLPLNEIVLSFVNSQVVSEISKIGAIYLLIPIGIDVIVIFLTKLLR